MQKESDIKLKGIVKVIEDDTLKPTDVFIVPLDVWKRALAGEDLKELAKQIIIIKNVK